MVRLTLIVLLCVSVGMAQDFSVHKRNGDRFYLTLDAINPEDSVLYRDSLRGSDISMTVEEYVNNVLGLFPSGITPLGLIRGPHRGDPHLYLNATANSVERGYVVNLITRNYVTIANAARMTEIIDAAISSNRAYLGGRLSNGSLGVNAYELDGAYDRTLVLPDITNLRHIATLGSNVYLLYVFGSNWELRRYNANDTETVVRSGTGAVAGLLTGKRSLAVEHDGGGYQKWSVVSQ